MAKKILTSTDLKCKNCGSDLFFDAKTQNLVCENCRSIKEFSKTQTNIKHNYEDNDYSYKKDWLESDLKLKCKSCGAEVPLNSLEFATFCPYCKSHYVANFEQFNGLLPERVYPFLLTKEDAQNKFKENAKKKFFVPSKFKKEIPNNTISGTYIPTFAFDAKTFTKYQAVVEESTGGKDNHTIRRVVNGTLSQNYTDFFEESSSLTTGIRLKSVLPYQEKSVYDFKPEFIRGYIVEHYDNSLTNCHKLFRQDVSNDIKKRISSQIAGNVVSITTNTTYSDEKYSYTLLPIYHFDFTYRNKQYKTIMNGQTGKLGKGLPISFWKVGLIVAILLILFGGIVALFLLAE